ncbi:hypothetical protein GE061_001623 [Apolygus lucorum]|uniref:Uncharacterized protein n=1 Tax=Apolygus lucorum TaxID=248454 RepID=A0A6A4K955_APOLU|nr:hypothetical protein GE061_001623 [Apolygus lucorum]
MLEIVDVSDPKKIFEFKKRRDLASGEIGRRCSVDRCNANLRTFGAGYGISEMSNNHNPEPMAPTQLKVQSLSASAKRKAVDQQSERPAKILRSLIDENNVEVLKTRDLCNIKKNMYNARRKSQPRLPKTLGKMHLPGLSLHVLPWLPACLASASPCLRYSVLCINRTSPYNSQSSPSFESSQMRPLKHNSALPSGYLLPRAPVIFPTTTGMQPIKAALLFFNGLFFVGGGGLLGLALWVGFSKDLDSMFRLLPTSLPHPLLYYAALACAVTGLLCSALALISFFAMASFNRCLLAAYIFGLVVLLIMETTAVIFLAATPHYLGLEIDPEALVDTWQRNYGVPGKEHYTISVDMVQTKYECCGVESGNEFSTSWWLLRELAAPGLVVPLSCCRQEPSIESYADPIPLNKTLCQDKNPESHRHARHTQGCLKSLRSWVCEQVTIALNVGGGTIASQLLLLLLSIMASVKLNKTSHR